MMIVGIDASNIRGGGGITHLSRLLMHANPFQFGFDKVIIWSGDKTLSQIDDKPWLKKVSLPALNKNLLHRSLWQRFSLSKAAISEKCDVLFVPGGSYAGKFKPFVTMSQNLLPFEWRELRRYGVSWMMLKLMLLRIVQSRTFRKSDGLIFLTDYAKKSVRKVIGRDVVSQAIIPHGIDQRFISRPIAGDSVESFLDRPLKLLYVSIVDMYKHQWNVVESVARLREMGKRVELTLIGPAYGPALRRLKKSIGQFDPKHEFVRYLGSVPYSDLETHYKSADMFVFASSCENLPNILLEAMGAGLPIVCSNRGPMSEVLGTGGLYFDPEDVGSLVDVVDQYMNSTSLRDEKMMEAFNRALQYDWKRCSDLTFEYLAMVARS